MHALHVIFQMMQGQIPSFSCDIWSTSCVFIQLISARLPGCWKQMRTRENMQYMVCVYVYLCTCKVATIIYILRWGITVTVISRIWFLSRRYQIWQKMCVLFFVTLYEEIHGHAPVPCSSLNTLHLWKVSDENDSVNVPVWMYGVFNFVEVIPLSLFLSTSSLLPFPFPVPLIFLSTTLSMWIWAVLRHWVHWSKSRPWYATVGSLYLPMRKFYLSECTFTIPKCFVLSTLSGYYIFL